MTHKVLHPGNCKQNVPVAVAVFHQSASAALTSYFPKKKKSEFLELFNTWWIICKSKFQFSNHIWAMRQKKKKMTGSRDFVVHLQIGLKIGVLRGSRHLNNCFFSLLTPKTLIRTLRCQASLIEDLMMGTISYFT